MLLPPGATGKTSSSAGILSSDKGASNSVIASGPSCWPPPGGMAGFCCCWEGSEYPGVPSRLLKALVLAMSPDVLLLILVDRRLVGVVWEICECQWYNNDAMKYSGAWNNPEVKVRILKYEHSPIVEFVLAYRIVLIGQILKLVGKWSMTNRYFKLMPILQYVNVGTIFYLVLTSARTHFNSCLHSRVTNIMEELLLRTLQIKDI